MNAVTLYGIDTLDKMALASVDESGTELKASLGFRGPLNLEVNATLHYDAGGGNTLDEPTQITLGLKNAELDLVLEAATQEEAASALTLSQAMAQPTGVDKGKALSPCAAATISALGLRDSLLRFEVSAPLVVSQTGGSVEAGLGDLISNTIGIANDLYLADLPAILDGLLARNVSSLINAAARSWLETAAGVRADNPDLCDQGASSPSAIKEALTNPQYLNLSAVEDSANAALNAIFGAGNITFHGGKNASGGGGSSGGGGFVPGQGYAVNLTMPLVKPSGEGTTIAINNVKPTEFDLKVLELQPGITEGIVMLDRAASDIKVQTTDDTITIHYTQGDDTSDAASLSAIQSVTVKQGDAIAKNVLGIRAKAKNLTLTTNATARINMALMDVVPVGVIWTGWGIGWGRKTARAQVRDSTPSTNSLTLRPLPCVTWPLHPSLLSSAPA